MINETCDFSVVSGGSAGRERDSHSSIACNPSSSTSFLRIPSKTSINPQPMQVAQRRAAENGEIDPIMECETKPSPSIKPSETAKRPSNGRRYILKVPKRTLKENIKRPEPRLPEKSPERLPLPASPMETKPEINCEQDSPTNTTNFVLSMPIISADTKPERALSPFTLPPFTLPYGIGFSTGRCIYTMAPSFGRATTTMVASDASRIAEESLGGARSAAWTFPVPNDATRIAEEMIARRQRVDLIGERLSANSIQPVLPVPSAPAFVAPLLPVIDDASASTENSPTTSADPKPKLRGRPSARKRDLPKVDDRLHKKNGTRVKKRRERTPEEDPESSAESDTVDIESMEEFACKWETCEKVFNTKKSFIDHVRNIHVDPTIEHSCGWRDCSRKKPFRALYMLVVHVRRHTGEKPHKCQVAGCSKEYSRLENLKTHERFHTGEKPYKCGAPNCEKAFSNASDRAKHTNRTHSNEKPYECGYQGCTKAYTDPSSLRKHVKTVHGDEVYEKLKMNKLMEAGGRWPKKIKSKKKDCGSKDRENSSSPDSAGPSSENPGSVETVGMNDPNNKSGREGETSAKNGNEKPISGLRFTVEGYLTADAELGEIAELQAIELGLPEARREDNHIYRSANFAPLYEQTGRIRVAGYEEDQDIAEEIIIEDPRNGTVTRMRVLQTVMRPPPPPPQIIDSYEAPTITALGSQHQSHMGDVGLMQMNVPVMPIQIPSVQSQPFNELDEETAQITRLAQNLRIDDRTIQQRFESHFEPLTPTPTPSPKSIMAVGATVATENDLLCRQIDDETPPMLNGHPVEQNEDDYLIEQQEIMLPAPPQPYLDTDSQEAIKERYQEAEEEEFVEVLYHQEPISASTYHEMDQIPAQTAMPIMSTAEVQPTLMVQSYQQHLQQQAVHCTDGLGMRVYPQEMPREMPILNGQHPQHYPQQSFMQACSQESTQEWEEPLCVESEFELRRQFDALFDSLPRSQEPVHLSSPEVDALSRDRMGVDGQSLPMDPSPQTPKNFFRSLSNLPRFLKKFNLRKN